MKQKLIEFLELEKKATPEPWHKKDAFNIECKNCDNELESVCCDVCDEEENTAYIQVCGLEIFAEPNAEFIAQSRTVAPLTARKLLEAVELLEKASSLLSSELGCTRQLSDEISKFLEDFNNEN